MPLQTTVLLIKSLDKPSAALPPHHISPQRIKRSETNPWITFGIALGAKHSGAMGSTNLRGEESQGEHQGDQFPGQKPQAQISVIFKEHLGGSTQQIQYLSE